jgi:hypothetical protein
MAQQKQTVRKTTTAKPTAAVKSPAKRVAEKQQKQANIEPQERHRLIAEAAYLIAEERGFQGGMALNDWLQAEAEVDARFAVTH